MGNVRTKYIFVTGGVVSSLGKGLASASIGALLELVNKMEVERAKLVGRIVKEVAVEKVRGAFRREKQEGEKDRLGFTFRDWLLQYTDNELAHQIFDTVIVAQLCARSHEVPANQFFQFMARMGADAFGYKAELRIDRGLAQLLRLRVSQLNNCTYCLSLHYEATRAGLSLQRKRGERDPDEVPDSKR